MTKTICKKLCVNGAVDTVTGLHVCMTLIMLYCSPPAGGVRVPWYLQDAVEGEQATLLGRTPGPCIADIDPAVQQSVRHAEAKVVEVRGLLQGQLRGHHTQRNAL